jgi:hypothetical protein
MEDGMGLAPLTGDFYNFQNLLTGEEQEIVGRVRRAHSCEHVQIS